ncbi:hypothetical protein ASE36_02885 [Rhizobium sp. Root274]|uniref:hypothetical protein n=1 Tax=unclassified Rhizobium TaxID=2613769 RepID=UPI000713E0C0|nr:MULTISPECIES: hypothetical protein [unclassified Rhizobium]KQW31235.1 hypothetical protein ASC71_02880 [Rhizobium sp. Root1240]KRD32780.1 hypothetical protein ASE36_02885 [Rhizobium sp. Root274]
MILLYIYMAVVAALHLIAGAMEYQGLKQQVSGANGFIWTMVTLLMTTVLFVTSIVTWIVWDGWTALKMLFLGGLWLALSGVASLALMMAGGRK